MIKTYQLKKQDPGRDPNPGEVHIIEPEDCNPAYLAWTCCRLAISQTAARHALDGNRKTGKAMIELMNKRLAMGDMPPVKKPDPPAPEGL